MPTIQASEFKAKCLEQFLGNCHARAARTYRSVPAGDRVALRTAAARVREIALDGRIGIRATQLENMHRDPADCFHRRYVLAAAGHADYRGREFADVAIGVGEAGCAAVITGRPGYEE
jgi:hypothetical protein